MQLQVTGLNQSYDKRTTIRQLGFNLGLFPVVKTILQGSITNQLINYS